MAWAVVAGVVFVAEIPTFALLVAAPLMVAAAVIAAGSAPGSAAVGKRKGIQTWTLHPAAFVFATPTHSSSKTPMLLAVVPVVNPFPPKSKGAQYLSR